MAAPALIDLILVRSSRTEWDAAARLGGDCDLPACATWGEELAEALLGVDASVVTAIVCGPDEASAQTANHIGQLAERKPRTIDDLREIDLGLWEGQRLDALEERYGAFKQWLDDPASVVAPEGESFEAAENRLMAALARAIEKLNGKAKHVVVVLRPLAFHVVRSRLAGVPLTENWDAAVSGPLVVPIQIERERLQPARGGV
ncbi:MAG: histidine phosphatase family protein [Planctomycetota bacterium]